MKKFLPLLFIAFLLVAFTRPAYSQCEIYNHSFEDWSDYPFAISDEDEPIILHYPDSFICITDIFYILFNGADSTFKSTLYKSTESVSGQYSVGIKSRSGEYGDLYTEGSCTQGAPDRMTGFFKFDGTDADSVLIYAEFFELVTPDSAVSIGLCEFAHSGSTDGFEQFSAPYVESMSGRADYYVITILNVNGQNEDTHLLIDDISFVRGAAKAQYEKDAFSISPNPAVGEIFINMGDTPVTSKTKVEIINASGATVVAPQSLELSNAIDISSLTSGFYVVKISDGHKVMTQKLMVTGK